MKEALLLDTHIALWLDSGNDRLLATTRNLIDLCWRNGGTIHLSAVTVWEIALLVDSERITLDLPVEAWVERFLSRPGIAAVELDCPAAARAYRLHHLEHRDPADRPLIATAIGLGCPLVTYDDRITRFAERHGGQYGFAGARLMALIARHCQRFLSKLYPEIETAQSVRDALKAVSTD